MKLKHRTLRMPRRSHAATDSPLNSTERASLFTFAAVLSTSALLVIVPCGIPLILASWFALLTRPWTLWLAARLHGRTKAAALVTAMALVAVLGPALLALIPIALSALKLMNEAGQAGHWEGAARIVVGEGGGDVELMKLMRDQASKGLGALPALLGASANILFSVAMFAVALFAFSASGEALVEWLRDRSPLKASHFDRLAGAYAETGRGLLFGVGVTALIQGVIATLTFAVVGMPRALVFGLLTTLGSFIPGIGTLLVWGPLSVILVLGGFPVKGAVVGLSGVLIIASVDNFLKPILSTRAHLKMPAVLVFVSMLSGIAAFGPAGLLLGPLFMRLAMEALDIAREERAL